jgi:hypothetical protein
MPHHALSVPSENTRQKLQVCAAAALRASTTTTRARQQRASSAHPVPSLTQLVPAAAEMFARQGPLALLGPRVSKPAWSVHLASTIMIVIRQLRVFCVRRGSLSALRGRSSAKAVLQDRCPLVAPHPAQLHRTRTLRRHVHHSGLHVVSRLAALKPCLKPSQHQLPLRAVQKICLRYCNACRSQRQQRCRLLLAAWIL